MKKALKYLKLDKGIILKIYKRLRDTDNVRRQQVKDKSLHRWTKQATEVTSDYESIHCSNC